MSEEEFNNLGFDDNLGVSWLEFGNAREKDIDDLLETNSIRGAKRIKLVALWKRHPGRQSLAGMNIKIYKINTGELDSSIALSSSIENGKAILIR